MLSVFALDLAAAMLSKLFTGFVEPWDVTARSVVYACAKRRAVLACGGKKSAGG